MLGAILAKHNVKSGFDLLNKGDLEQVIKGWVDDCVWKYNGNVKAGGTFTGKNQVKKWFEDFFKQFPQRKFTLKHIAIDNIFDLIGTNTILARWDIELTNKDGFSFLNTGVTVLKIKGGKIYEGEDFLSISDGDDYCRAWGDIK